MISDVCQNLRYLFDASHSWLCFFSNNTFWQGGSRENNDYLFSTRAEWIDEAHYNLETRPKREDKTTSIYIHCIAFICTLLCSALLHNHKLISAAASHSLFILLEPSFLCNLHARSPPSIWLSAMLSCLIVRRTMEAASFPIHGS